MKPTILFDMDGVIVRSEQLWNECEPAYLLRVLDTSIAEQIIGKTRGNSMSLIYEMAKKHGTYGLKKTILQRI